MTECPKQAEAQHLRKVVPPLFDQATLRLLCPVQRSIAVAEKRHHSIFSVSFQNHPLSLEQKIQCDPCFAGLCFVLLSVVIIQ